MPTLAERLDRVSFEGSTLEALPYDDIRAALAEHTIVRVRGLFDRDEIRNTVAGIVSRCHSTNDRRHDPRDTDAARRNFQKLQVGANSGVNSRRSLGRFMRVLYNPIFADDVLGMRAHFVKLARFRNLLYKAPIDFAVHGTDDGCWTCSRILQPILLLTEKGVDFHEGGAYVDIGDDRLLYEEVCWSGDVVVYDGRSMHGVSDIDPLEPLDLSRLTGRLVALATIFKQLTSGSDDYERLAKKANEIYEQKP